MNPEGLIILSAGYVGAMAGIRAILILSLALAGLAAPPPAAAGEVQETAISFGVPRREVAPGLDVAAACGVVAAYEGLALCDGGTDETFLALSPGPCEITVYVLGAGIALPIMNSAPIGRTSYLIPGVGGITLGLADVSIDLLVSVDARQTSEVDGLAVTPTNASWSRWGATTLAVDASMGATGSTMHLALPFNVTMNLSVGVSVYAFGIRLYSVSLASLGIVEGAPSLDIPVVVDLRPSAVTASAWGPTHAAIRVNWTLNTDDDFAYVRIVVAPDGGTQTVFLVEDPAATSTDIPAFPATDYTIEVSVVDRGGQVSDVSSVTVRTPPENVLSAPEALAVLGVVAVSLLVGLGLGLLVRRRKTGDRT